MTADLIITLVDYRDRTVTVTRYPRGKMADAERIGRNYMLGWNERGFAEWGDDFRSRADGFRVHGDDGRILAYG